MSADKHSVSFVIPCLNERATLPAVLDAIAKVCSGPLRDRDTEVIVVDNGSTDGSMEIAKGKGAEVICCRQRGYGAAIQCGIANAHNDVIVVADADNTYDLGEAPRLVGELEKGFDLVLGSRLRGEIHPGAMPFLHRRLGTPMLNMLINALYGRRGNRASDCNSGFRCFRRDAFLSWRAASPGMEFASEMLIKAMKAGARLSEVPISLRPDCGPRVPHLSTWCDGMRHLLHILMESPAAFHHAGTVIFLLSWLAILTGLFVGPVDLGFARVFGLHTMLFALMGSVFGIVVWATGLFLAAKNPSTVWIYQRLLTLSEDKLFWSSAGLFVAFLAAFVLIVINWASHGLDLLALQKETVVVVAFTSDGMLVVFNVITAHLLKRP